MTRNDVDLEILIVLLNQTNLHSFLFYKYVTFHAPIGMRQRWVEMKNMALKANGLNLDLVANDGKTPILLAIENGHVALAKWLLDSDCDVNVL